MDFLSQLGPLGLASRLRRLTEKMTQEASLLYRELDLAFEPRWFPVYYLLARQPSLGIVEIARMLGVSHPAVHHISNELIRAGLVIAVKDSTDRRKRLLCLSEEGRQLLPTLEAIWDTIRQASTDLLAESPHDLLLALNAFEQAYRQKNLRTRFFERQAKHHESVTLPPNPQEPNTLNTLVSTR